jgi:hypothetical protein
LRLCSTTTAAEKDAKMENRGALLPMPIIALAPPPGASKSFLAVAGDDQIWDYYALLRWADDGGRWFERSTLASEEARI